MYSDAVFYPMSFPDSEVLSGWPIQTPLEAFKASYTSAEQEYPSKGLPFRSDHGYSALESRRMSANMSSRQACWEYQSQYYFLENVDLGRGMASDSVIWGLGIMTRNLTHLCEHLFAAGNHLLNVVLS